MPGQTLGSPAYTTSSASGFDRALKELYPRKMNTIINRRNILLNMLRRQSKVKQVSGRRVVQPINIRGSQALGARNATGTTPSPQSQTIIEALIPPNYLYGTVQFDLPTIRAARNDAGAFARVMDVEMNGMRRDAQNDLNRQLFGNSLGSLGTVNGAVTASTAVTMDTGHKVKTGMILDFYTNSSGDPSTTTSATSVKVSATTSTTLTMATLVTLVDNDHAVREGNRGNEVLGLLGTVDDDTGTYMGISRNTYAEWRAQVVSASSGDISDSLMQQVFLNAEEQGEGEINLIISSYLQWRRYGLTLSPDRRYTPAMKLQGGFTALDFNGKPFVADRDCDNNGTQNIAYFLDMDSFQILEMSDGWEWDDTDGRILHKVANQPAYDATLYYYLELFCSDPANNGRLESLSTS